MATEIVAILFTALASFLGSVGIVWRSTAQARIDRAKWEREKDDEMVARLDSAQRTLVELMNARLAEKDGQIEAIRGEMAEERARRVRTETQLDQARIEIRQLQEQLNDQHIRLATATRDLEKMHQLEKLVSDQEQRILNMQVREQRAINDAVILERQLSQRLAEISMLEESNNAMRDRVGELEASAATWRGRALVCEDGRATGDNKVSDRKDEVGHDASDKADSGGPGADAGGDASDGAG